MKSQVPRLPACLPALSWDLALVPLVSDSPVQASSSWSLGKVSRGPWMVHVWNWTRNTRVRSVPRPPL